MQDLKKSPQNDHDFLNNYAQPPLDLAKIARIKKAIKDGDYQMSAASLAEKIIAMEESHLPSV